MPAGMVRFAVGNGGVENLARAMIARALKDYVNGPEKMKEEAGRMF